MSIGRIYPAPILPEPVIRSDISDSEKTFAGFITRIIYAANKDRLDSLKYKVNERVSLNELPPTNKRWFGDTPSLSDSAAKPAPVKLTRGVFSPFSGKLDVRNLKLNRFGSYSPEKATVKYFPKETKSKPKKFIQGVGYEHELKRFICKLSKENIYPDDETLLEIMNTIEAGKNPYGSYRKIIPDSERPILRKSNAERPALSQPAPIRPVSPKPASEPSVLSQPAPIRPTSQKPASERPALLQPISASPTLPKSESERRTLPKVIGEIFSSLSDSDSGCDSPADSDDAGRPPVPLEPVVIIKTAEDKKVENLQVKMDDFYNQFEGSRAKKKEIRRPNPSPFVPRAHVSNHYLIKNSTPNSNATPGSHYRLVSHLQPIKYEDFVIPFRHADYLSMENDKNRPLSVKSVDDNDILDEIKAGLKKHADIFEESQAYHYARYKKLREKIDGLNGVLETIDENSILFLPPVAEINDYYHSLRDEIMLAIARENKTIIVDDAGRKVNPLYVEDEPDY